MSGECGKIFRRAVAALALLWTGSAVAEGPPLVVGVDGTFAPHAMSKLGGGYGEIVRAGIESIGLSQREAARSTGLSAAHTMVYVILPQAIRAVVPDPIGNTLEVVKLTSIASVVALPELLYVARSAQALTYNPSPIVAAAALYLVLLWPFVRLLSRFERRMLAVA